MKTKIKANDALSLNTIYTPITGLNESNTNKAIAHLRSRYELSEKVIDRILPKISEAITRLSIAAVYCSDHQYFAGLEARCIDLRKTYGDKHWRYIIKTLVAIDVVKVNHSYSNGYNETDRFAKKYKLRGLPDEVDVNLAPVPREELLKHLMRLKSKRKNASHTLDPRKVLDAIFRKHLPSTNYTQRQLFHAVLDIYKVEQFLESKYYKHAKKLNKRGICSTGRQFTPLNGLPKYIRAMITHKGQATVQLDFSACAPSTLYKLFEDESEKAIWRDLIANDIYSSLGLRMSRKQVKKAFVTFIGGKGINQMDGRVENARVERKQLRELDEKLRELVPIAHRRMEEMREQKELIHFTQKIESEVIIPIVEQFESAASVHDCILCSPDDAEVVELLMKSRFEELVGVKPSVTRE